jgi:hypothetical protein
MSTRPSCLLAARAAILAFRSGNTPPRGRRTLATAPIFCAMSDPLPITAEQFTTILATRDRLPPALRGQFLEQVAARLRAYPLQFNDRDVSAAATAAMHAVVNGHRHK